MSTPSLANLLSQANSASFHALDSSNNVSNWVTNRTNSSDFSNLFASKLATNESVPIPVAAPVAQTIQSSTASTTSSIPTTTTSSQPTSPRAPEINREVNQSSTEQPRNHSQETSSVEPPKSNSPQEPVTTKPQDNPEQTATDNTEKSQETSQETDPTASPLTPSLARAKAEDSKPASTDDQTVSSATSPAADIAALLASVANTAQTTLPSPQNARSTTDDVVTSSKAGQTPTLNNSTWQGSSNIVSQTTTDVRDTNLSAGQAAASQSDLAAHLDSFAQKFLATQQRAEPQQTPQILASQQTPQTLASQKATAQTPTKPVATETNTIPTIQTQQTSISNDQNLVSGTEAKQPLNSAESPATDGKITQATDMTTVSSQTNSATTSITADNSHGQTSISGQNDALATQSPVDKSVQTSATPAKIEQPQQPVSILNEPSPTPQDAPPLSVDQKKAVDISTSNTGNPNQQAGGNTQENSSNPSSQWLAATSTSTSKPAPDSQNFSSTLQREEGETVTTDLSSTGSVTSNYSVNQQKINDSFSAHSAVPSSQMKTPVGEKGWHEEFASQVVWSGSRDNGKAEIVLNPGNLGRIEVTVNLTGDQAVANFVTSSAHAKEALEQAMPRLKEVLEQSGISLGQTNVSSDSSAGNTAFNQNNDEQRNSRNSGNRTTQTTQTTETATQSRVTRLSDGAVDTFA